ncbi:MAG: DNA polymerase [Candidatus Saccharibacteria bacterium]|nr:DNA polymerase [Candidatus Saccharibacteria bacterium]
MKNLVLIDGKSVFYRGYYAMGALSLPDGTPTGGVYGFAAIAMEIVKRLNPTKVVVTWDSKTSTSRRRELYKDYKAGRVKPGDDFYAQIPLLKELVGDLGWDFVEVDDYEADDIIGTLGREADEAGDWETFIISSDLDMLQIVDHNTHMWRILKGFSNIEKIDIAEFEKKYGIKQAQFLDLKALKGDASDNIPGVSGIGEKTAVKLLNEFETLDGIYANLEKIKGATKTKLEAGKESAYLSKRLAEIMFDAPVSLNDLPDFQFNEKRVIEGLKKLEFNSLIRKISGNILQEKPAIDIKPIHAEKDLIIAWNIKTLMHDDEKIATKILDGAKFWDLSQAAFLINPLVREDPHLIIPEEEYRNQLSELEKTPRVLEVLRNFDLPLIPILYQMEKKGMLIDRNYFKKLEKEYAAEVQKIESEIFALAGREFNLNSPVQLSDVLFNTLRLPTKGIKKTARGYSTGAKELEKLQDQHVIISKIVEFREAAKLLSTYIIPIPALADTKDRIHTTFNQNVTATGRLSSTNPNLQNIPVRTDAGKRIRTGFIAPEGRTLVSADYSQFELRLAAILSHDEPLINDFNSGIDIHTKTASEAFNVPFESVTKDQRRAAKVINFGVLYGMSASGLASAAKMPIWEAKQFIDNYFKLRAPIKEKLDEILNHAREEGFVETFYGRRRPTPDVKSSNFLVRQAAERAAMNMPIQGTEADLMKRAMIDVSKLLPKSADLVMQVHDSLIIECDENDAENVANILQTAMESVAPELGIKLAVDVSIGKNWGEL